MDTQQASHESQAPAQAPRAAPAKTPLTASQRRARSLVILLAFATFSIFMLGIFWTRSHDVATASLLTLSYVAGLTMIFLPCTLPLAFVIVPLCMGKGYMKGLLMALYFGLGLSLMLSVYGAGIAYLGGRIGLDKATELMFVVGGIAAVLFGLGELKLIRLQLPAYSGAIPSFIQRRGDYVKAFLLGLFLGNAGVGCPNPAFYILLGAVAAQADVFKGWYLLLIHGIGRATPLIFLAILGILGVNALSVIVKRKEAVERAIGWALLGIGVFILSNGIFSHDWYVQTGLHTFWEKVVEKTAGAQFGELVERHQHELEQNAFFTFGNWFLVLGIGLPIIWRYFQRRKQLNALKAQAGVDPKLVAHEEKSLKRFVVVGTIVILVMIGLFTQFFPKIYAPAHVPHGIQEEGTPAAKEPILANAAEADTATFPSFRVRFTMDPIRPSAGQETKLTFTFTTASGDPYDRFAVSHEERMHLLVTREDFTNFVHIHPGHVRPNEYVVYHTFPEEGRYHLWADFVDDDGQPYIAAFSRDTKKAITGLVPNADVSLDKVVAGYHVKITTTPTQPLAGTKSEIHASVTEVATDQPVTYGTYLGAPAHLVGANNTFTAYLHTHGTVPASSSATEDTHNHSLLPVAYAHGTEDSTAPVSGSSTNATPQTNELHFEATLDEPGLWGLWIQFRLQGNPTVITVPFMLSVE